MYAQAVDVAGTRLRELRREQWQDFVLGGVALALAMVATKRMPSLALPLFIGGTALGVLGIRALWRQWDLVDRLAERADAYVLPEVLAYATRETRMERRCAFAVQIRSQLDSVGEDEAAELAELADDLEDEALVLDPASAVACAHLVNEPSGSPLLDPACRDALPSSVRRIRSGFTRKPVDGA